MIQVQLNLLTDFLNSSYGSRKCLVGGAGSKIPSLQGGKLAVCSIVSRLEANPEMDNRVLGEIHHGLWAQPHTASYFTFSFHVVISLLVFKKTCPSIFILAVLT